MVNVRRWLIHVFTPPWRWRLVFPVALLNDIELAVQRSEIRHRGELRFAIENTLAPIRVWRGLAARQRATEVFSTLKVWDTEENSGVLIYLMLADKEVHIVADRGITKQVTQKQWDEVAKLMQQAFHRGDFRTGSLAGIEQITEYLCAHFPANTENPNELVDRPVIVNR